MDLLIIIDNIYSTRILMNLHVKYSNSYLNLDFCLFVFVADRGPFFLQNPL